MLVLYVTCTCNSKYMTREHLLSLDDSREELSRLSRSHLPRYTTVNWTTSQPRVSALAPPPCLRLSRGNSDSYALIY